MLVQFKKLLPHGILSAALSGALAFGAVACGSDETPNDMPPPTSGKVSRGVLATSNPAGRSNDKLLRLATNLQSTQSTFADIDVVTSIQSLSLDAAGDGYVTYDGRAMTGGIAVYPALRDASESAVLGGGARVIAGSKTELVAPRGVLALDALRLVIVADFGARDIKAYPLDARGDVAPSHVIPLGDEARSVWDITYDAASDTLYAAGTDGVALAYDDFSMTRGEYGPTRTITPTGLGNVQISVNLHGIVYIPALDLLILSDVGDPTSATDGQLISVAAASTADGNTIANLRVRGASSGLGNPVDLFYEGTNLFVAEKSGNRVLRFDALAARVGELDLEPELSLEVERVESIALGVRGGIGGGALLAVANPDGVEADAIVQLPFSLSAVSARLTDLGRVTSIESVALGADGAGFVSYASGPQGGIMLLDALDANTTGGTLGLGAGTLSGPLTTLVAPKGLDASSEVLIVADFGAKAIKVFGKEAGDVAPQWSTTDLGDATGSVWDLAYDAAADRLFVAGTDGSLLVYDDYLADRGAAGPTRTVRIAGAVNLHGIAYHAATDTLFLSDVGDTMSATDGQLFVLASASTASGAVTARAVIKGAQSKLGNPVDVALDGAQLYVAEKSNDVVLRFDGLAELTGTSDRPAAASTAVVKAESVVIIPAE